MRAVIVDDEIHARRELQVLLEETGEFKIVEKCANALEGIRAISSHRPDVLFLDIQMPVISGFEMLSMIDEEITPRVVFVTAYGEYAIQAFEENAIDYLLKPVEAQRLTKTVQKLKRMFREGATRAQVYPTPEIKRIPCSTPNRIKLIDVAEVEYVKSDIAGVYLICVKGRYFTDLTLKVLESKARLARCHKQYLVNLDHVDEIYLTENHSAVITTKSGKDLPVSRRHLKRLKEIIGVGAARTQG
jgi:two-component system LytT family response regulator